MKRWDQEGLRDSTSTRIEKTSAPHHWEVYAHSRKPIGHGDGQYDRRGGRDRKLHALDPNTGRGKWSFTTDGNIDGSPVVVGDRVYGGSMSLDDCFSVLNLTTRRKLQEMELDSSVTASVAVGPHCLLVGTER